MGTTRFAVALAAALLCLPAWPQVPAKAPAERGSLPLRDPAPSELLSELRGGGYILYFRHAATDFSQNDSKMKSHEDCASQRNLTDKGRADASAVGAAIRQLGIPVGSVLASPFCRTVETAQIAFGRAQKTQQVRGGPAAPADSGRYAELRKLLTTPIQKDANLAVVSHGNPFHSVAGPPYLAEGEAAVIRPLGSGFEVFARIRVEDWERLKGAAKD
jgi:phosphohistidine phosphatase SixA